MVIPNWSLRIESVIKEQLHNLRSGLRLLICAAQPSRSVLVGVLEVITGPSVCFAIPASFCNKARP